MNEHIFSQGTKIRPLWGTAPLFMHPRYMHGGATSFTSQKSIFHLVCRHNPEIGVYAYAATQVKKAIERNRMPLIGRAIDDHDMKRVLELLKNDPDTDFNGVTLVQNYLSRTGPKEWAKKKDNAEMLKIMSIYGEEVVTALGSEVDRIEKEILETIPGIRHVDIEAHNPIIPPP
ncbi:putative xylose isomerase-like superfamily, Zinc transporter 9 [Helianthus anomalus]